MRECGAVDDSPGPGPGVVAQQSGIAVAFPVDSDRREHEVSHVVLGQCGPEVVFNELIHLASHEVPLLGS